MTYQDEKTTTDPRSDGQGDWPDGEPTPLTRSVDVPAWPVDALPKPIADMVNGVAEATQTDPAMAATSALSALSACTGGHAVIEIRSGWREPLNLYTVAIAEPGERKSAVQETMVSPIHAAEESLAAANQAARTEAETEKQVATRNAERLRTAAASAAANATPEQRRDALSQAQMAALYAESLEVPSVPRLVADNITPEKVASLLAGQGGRLAVITAEGGIFDIIAGRYSKSNLPDLDIWLKGHSGDRLKVDRIGREPENIPHPALTLGLMIQPQVLSVIAARQDFRGRGLLARFLYARPVSKIGHRLIGAPVASEVEAAYHDAVKDLATGMAAWSGDNRAVLTLTEDARAEFERIEAAVEPTLAKDGELALLVDWGAKFAGAVARIAGIIHLAERGAATGTCSSVGVETIKDAERIGEYCKCAAINVFAEMGTDQITADAAYLLERIRHLRCDEVSERDVHVASSRSRFPTKAELKFVLAVLVDHGWLAPPTKPESTGGRPASPRYRVHPRITEDTEATEDLHPPAPFAAHAASSGEETTDEEQGGSPDPSVASVAFVSPSGPEAIHDRLKGVITRRLQKVGQARRYQLRMATESKDRAGFDVIFDSLVECKYLVTVEGDEALWRLSNHVTKAPEATEGGESGP